MRPDMPRLIVERPRYGSRRRDAPPPLLDGPQREAMRRPHRLARREKELSDNLAPLRRYLAAQIGRPWDKVYSEIVQQARGGAMLRRHLLSHIADFVAVKPRRVNGTYCSLTGMPIGRFVRLWHQPFYVDRRDGLLKRTDRLRRRERS